MRDSSIASVSYFKQKQGGKNNGSPALSFQAGIDTSDILDLDS